MPSDEVKHTPGPWTANLARLIKGAPVFGYTVTAGEKEHSLANVGVYENTAITFGFDHHKDNAEWVLSRFYTEAELIANARLIAAAPDLFAALREIVNGCDAPADSEKGESLALFMVGVLPAARAAIAKATGAA